MKTKSAIVILILALGCKGAEKEIDQEPIGGIEAVEAFPGLTFSSPVDIAHANDGSDRIYIAEQAGIIKVVDGSAASPAAVTFLDIRSKVLSGGERGLLGLAFHPNFKDNGYFYVNYTRGSPLTSVIARYKAGSSTVNAVAATSENILFTFAQPYDNHNGGALQFGKDGYLYIGAGDGGSGGDPQNNAQNRRNLLGKILRVDVNSIDKGFYGIPSDNPFTNQSEGYAPEIYAWGLRNPWKISFETASDLLFTADVGQNSREEINLISKGGNYGWRVKEGINCYNPSTGCNDAGLIAPIYDYSQSNGDRSITGGYVYRGTALPELVGKYIYGDYVSGKIWRLDMTGSRAGANELLIENAGSVSTFGQDKNGELVFANYGNGKIMKLSRTKAL
jgi:glucose/arabinose dehydrogenase